MLTSSARCPASLLAVGPAGCSGDGTGRPAFASPRSSRRIAPLRAAPSRGPGGGPATEWAPRPPPADYYAPTRVGPGGPGGPGDGGGGGRGPNGRDDAPLSNLTKAFIAGAFIMGMGAGVWFNSGATFTPANVASTELIDRKTPNSEVCLANGYSSMVFDQRIFVSFNPFNVYVTQPEVKPGCVVRRANIGLLEQRGLVTGQEVRACTRNMNTFAFVGDLTGSPEVACVYHSEDAENQFLRDPKRSVMGDGSRAPATEQAK